MTCFWEAPEMIVILGGTGAYFLDLAAELGPGEYRSMATPYGPAGSVYVPERWQGRIGLASRHGWGRLEVSPPFVNSRANIWAARELGATHILSWNGVGAINPLLQVHDLVVLDGVLNGTKTRPTSFAGALPGPDEWRTVQRLSAPRCRPSPGRASRAPSAASTPAPRGRAWRPPPRSPPGAASGPRWSA
jgi:5'-methylthioadenosine phosphorylase